MLKQFNFRNFRSFYEEEDLRTVELSMMAGRTKIHPEHLYPNGKEKLLSSALVFGANGSGKSNLVAALDFMRQCVLYKVPPRFYSSYNRNHPENLETPSYFEVELVINGNNYIYGFETIISNGEFVNEWLLSRNVNTGRENVLFERDMRTGEFSTDVIDKELKNRLEIYLSDMAVNKYRLFVNSLADKDNLFKDFPGSKPILDVSMWFRNNLQVISPDSGPAEYSKLTSEKYIHRFESLLSSFGTGINEIHRFECPNQDLLNKLPQEAQDFLVAALTREKNELDDKTVSVFQLIAGNDLFLIKQTKEETKTYKLAFTHEGVDPKTLFSLKNESDGTQRFIDLADVLLDNEDKVIVIDELDRCLHPNMTYQFLSEFLHQAKDKHSQIICTTHTTCLLDFDLIRRDEVWFVERDTEGNSHLYSLEEYNERFDRVIEKSYLSGRYGAVPTFNTLYRAGDRETDERTEG